MDDSLNAHDFTIPHWYALFVRSNQEKQVAAYLNGLLMEYYLPSYASVRRWKDRRVKLEMPLFPGYLFVRLPLQERMKVLNIRQVVSLVGKKNSPSPISDDEIAGIKAAVEHGNAEPHDYLEVGRKMVITDGVMCGMAGVVLSVRSRARLVISVQSIGRAFVVEVSADCVRPLSDPREPHYRFVPSTSASLPGAIDRPDLSQVSLVSATSPEQMIERN